MRGKLPALPLGLARGAEAVKECKASCPVLSWPIERRISAQTCPRWHTPPLVPLLHAPAAPRRRPTSQTGGMAASMPACTPGPGGHKLAPAAVHSLPDEVLARTLGELPPKDRSEQRGRAGAATRNRGGKAASA